MSVNPELEKVCQEFTISPEKMEKFTKLFRKALELGLRKVSRNSSSLKCFITYMQHLPATIESGKYVGLDVGGLMIRIILVDLAGGKCSTKSKIFRFPEFTYSCSSAQFFDLLARYVAESLQDLGVAMDNLPLGFSLGFPVRQRSIKSGMLEKWTKKFSIKDVVGKDVGVLLGEALRRRQLVNVCQEFKMTPEKLLIFTQEFRNAIEMGLCKSSHKSSTVKCYVTYVQNLPPGNVMGKFAVMDLEGTMVRIISAEFDGSKYSMQSKTFRLPEFAYSCSHVQFFDILARYLAETLTDFGVAMNNLPLGFSFCFPIIQKNIRSGVLERWTKRFNIKGVVGKDIVALMIDALKKRPDVKVKIVAILNDATGTLVSCAYDHPNCRIGCIFGSGSNACYMEQQKNAELFDDIDHGSGEVIINTEWGGFGDDGVLDFLRTDHDFEVDKKSINPGRQIHEKMIAGLYLGEICRLAMLSYMKAGIFLHKRFEPVLSKRGIFETNYISEIEGEREGVYINCKRIFKQMGLDDISEKDCFGIKYVCSCVTKRAAYLVAAALSVLVNKMQNPDITIGVDGALYKNHPKIPGLMNYKLKELVDPDIKFKIVNTEDGSGKGAALVAASVRHGFSDIEVVQQGCKFFPCK